LPGQSIAILETPTLEFGRFNEGRTVVRRLLWREHQATWFRAVAIK
jgi:hypothetical protein